MNRCLRLLVSLCGLVPCLLWAQFQRFEQPERSAVAGRAFPASAVDADFQVLAPPSIWVNGKADRLSPGARIRDAQNRLVLSASLVGQHLAVKLVRNAQGDAHEVWILSESEAQEQPRRTPTQTNVEFASSRDKLPVDDGKTPFDQLPRFIGAPQPAFSAQPAVPDR